MSNSNTDVSAILANESFRKLVRIRSTVRFTLAFMVLGLHAFFVGGIAYYTQWFGTPIAVDSSIPRGIFYTVVIILAMVFLELVYIWITHRTLDPLQEKVTAEVESHV